jgi:hypothetical protein
VLLPGEFKELSSIVANQRQQVTIVETGETIPMTSPDQVLDVIQTASDTGIRQIL